MIFRHPHFLWLLPLALLPLYFEFIARRAGGTLGYSAVDEAWRAGLSLRVIGRRALAILRAAAIALAIVALARPQAGDEQSKVGVEGIAIQLVVDRSGSMAQQDMAYEGRTMSRLEASRRVIDRFIRARKDDLIGLAAFSAYPNEIAPLTLDYGMLSKFLENLTPDKLFGQTAIGDGIVYSANLLKETTAKSKIIILLTDGANNFGVTNPVEAARIAAELGVKIYTIGIIPPAGASPAIDFFGRQFFQQGADVDEETLKAVAASGGGRYYAASDGEKLERIYDEINRLEKTEQITERFLQYRELFAAPLCASIGLTVMESLLGLTLFRKKP